MYLYIYIHPFSLLSFTVQPIPVLGRVDLAGWLLWMIYWRCLYDNHSSDVTINAWLQQLLLNCRILSEWLPLNMPINVLHFTLQRFFSVVRNLKRSACSLVSRRGRIMMDDRWWMMDECMDGWVDGMDGWWLYIPIHTSLYWEEKHWVLSVVFM